MQEELRSAAIESKKEKKADVVMNEPPQKDKEQEYEESRESEVEAAVPQAKESEKQAD